MLVLLIILSLSLILGFIFLGFKLSETIKEADNKALFWILYFVSLLTILQLIICFIFFFKYKKKVGPLGPRGFMGERGEQGEKGSCGELDDGSQDDNCRKKTFMLLIIKIFRESLGRELNSDETNIIYYFVYIQKIPLDVDLPEPPSTIRPLDLTKTSYQNLRDFDAKLRMIIAEKIQEKNENFESIENIVKDVLSDTEVEVEVEGDTKIFPVSDSSSSSVGITRIPAP